MVSKIKYSVNYCNTENIALNNLVIGKHFVNEIFIFGFAEKIYQPYYSFSANSKMNLIYKNCI